MLSKLSRQGTSESPFKLLVVRRFVADARKRFQTQKGSNGMWATQTLQKRPRRRSLFEYTWIYILHHLTSFYIFAYALIPERHFQLWGSDIHLCVILSLSEILWDKCNMSEHFPWRWLKTGDEWVVWLTYWFTCVEFCHTKTLVRKTMGSWETGRTIRNHCAEGCKNLRPLCKHPKFCELGVTSAGVLPWAISPHKWLKKMDMKNSQGPQSVRWNPQAQLKITPAMSGQIRRMSQDLRHWSVEFRGRVVIVKVAACWKSAKDWQNHKWCTFRIIQVYPSWVSWLTYIAQCHESWDLPAGDS